MTYTATEIQSFTAQIDNVVFTNEEQYYAVQRILDRIENNYTPDTLIHFPDNFIKDIAQEIEQIWYKYPEVSYQDILDALVINYETGEIEEYDTELKDLVILSEYDTYWFDYINNKLQNGEYTFKLEMN